MNRYEWIFIVLCVLLVVVITMVGCEKDKDTDDLILSVGSTVGTNPLVIGLRSEANFTNKMQCCECGKYFIDHLNIVFFDSKEEAASHPDYFTYYGYDGKVWSEACDSCYFGEDWVSRYGESCIEVDRVEITNSGAVITEEGL